MFGCLRLIGCLVVLALLAIGGWWYFAGRDRGDIPGEQTATEWQPLNQASAESGKRKLESLRTASGPGRATLNAGEAASYIFLEATRQLPSSTQNAAARIAGDRLQLRANIDLRDMGGPRILGPLGSFIGERDTVELGGSIQVLRPELGQLRIRHVKFGRLDLPPQLIPRMVREIRRGVVPPELAEDAFAVPLPPYIGDVQVARGVITVYRDAP